MATTSIGRRDVRPTQGAVALKECQDFLGASLKWTIEGFRDKYHDDSATIDRFNDHISPEIEKNKACRGILSSKRIRDVA